MKITLRGIPTGLRGGSMACYVGWGYVGVPGPGFRLQASHLVPRIFVFRVAFSIFFRKIDFILEKPICSSKKHFRSILSSKNQYSPSQKIDVLHPKLIFAVKRRFLPPRTIKVHRVIIVTEPDRGGVSLTGLSCTAQFYRPHLLPEPDLSQG